MEHDFTKFPIRIAIVLRFGLVNAITIEFLCKSNSFFSFYKRKLKKRINFPVPLIHCSTIFPTAYKRKGDNGMIRQASSVIVLLLFLFGFYFNDFEFTEYRMVSVCPSSA